MSDPNLKWLKQIILSKPNTKELPKLDKNDPNTIIKRKLLKQMSNLQIKKDLIYLVDEDKFKNKRYRYLMPRNEVELTIKELHSKETAGHLGVDKTIEKIKQRFFWINLSRDVKKFIRECYDCQKAKPPKVYCKPKLVPLAPSRTLQLVTMDMAGPLPTTKEGHKYILAICDHIT